MRIKNIRPIDPVLSKCISVDNTNKLFAIGKNNLLTRNSVAQQNIIIIGCLLRPKHWCILGIDLKRVELSRYRKFGMSVATDLETAIEFLRFGQAVMMKRYEKLEELGENNFMDLPEKSQALLIMIDELGELLSPSGVKTEEGKMIDELKGEAVMIIGSIARLGRAAGVHLVLATQRPDAKILPGEVRNNFGVRIGCGRFDSTASTMMFNSNAGCRIRGNPKGGMYIQIHGQGVMGQGFFAPNNWLEEYYERTGTTPELDNSAIGDIPDQVEQKEKSDALSDWDDDMDDFID